MSISFIRRRSRPRYSPLGPGGRYHQWHHRRRHLWPAFEDLRAHRYLQPAGLHRLRARCHADHSLLCRSWQPVRGNWRAYLYAREAFGPTVAFEVGWLIWLARLTAFAANCNLMVSYIGFFWPQATSTIPRALIITVVVVALTALNITGVRQAAIASNVFTIGKLIPLLIFIAAGLFFLNPSAFAFGAAPSTGAFSTSVLLLIYAFTGFEMAAIPAGETKDPRRDLPRALLIAIGVVAVVYVLIQVVSIGTLPGLANSTKPLADAGQQFWERLGARLISAGAIISITGNLTLFAVRLARAFRDCRTETVARVHRYRSPPLLYSTRFHPDHRGDHAHPNAEEFIRSGADDQRDCAAGDLRSYMSGVAGAAAEERCARSRVPCSWWNHHRYSLPDSDCLAVTQQHPVRSDSCRDCRGRRVRYLPGVLVLSQACFVNNSAIHDRHNYLHLLNLFWINFEDVARENDEISQLARRDCSFLVLLRLSVSRADRVSADGFFN